MDAIRSERQSAQGDGEGVLKFCIPGPFLALLLVRYAFNNLLVPGTYTIIEQSEANLITTSTQTRKKKIARQEQQQQTKRDMTTRHKNIDLQKVGDSTVVYFDVFLGAETYAKFGAVTIGLSLSFSF